MSSEPVGYDAERMCYNFIMMNRDAVIQCAISSAALDDLVRNRGRSGCDRDAQFQAFREEIEALASVVFDNSGLDRGAVRIFAKHFRSRK